jgi:hypothetical protein
LSLPPAQVTAVLETVASLASSLSASADGDDGDAENDMVVAGVTTGAKLVDALLSAAETVEESTTVATSTTAAIPASSFASTAVAPSAIAKREVPRLETLLITGPKARAQSTTRKDSYPDVPSLRECLRFAIPALGIYCAGPLMSLIDAAFVGRASSLQLASLGPASSISDSAPLPLLFLSIGATNLVARAHGRSDLREQALTLALFYIPGGGRRAEPAPW